MSTVASDASVQPRPAFASEVLGLYAATVFVWGVSWYAVKLQVGVIAPEVSVFWRFVLAAMVMLAFAVWRDAPLKFPWRTHVRFAALGAFIFSTNFVLFYYGGLYVPSGLLAVVFSLTSVFNLVLGAIFLGQRVSGRILLGGLLGVTGVACLFWPQIAATGGLLDTGALIGLAFCVGGTLSFCCGNIVSASNQTRGIPIVSASTWGMIYGAILLAIVSSVRGHSFAVEWTAIYLGSLVYLAVFASVVAFACYLTLIGRIGSARAGYATVLFPVVALIVSSVLEDFSWGLPAFAGLACVLAGNLLVLNPGSASNRAAATTA